LRVAYLIHDVTDAAVAKRVRMLKAAGADVVLAGFRRQEQGPSSLEGCQVIDLGQTYDGKFGQRIKAVARRWMEAKMLAEKIGPVDVVLCRTLEMLALGERVRRALPGPASLVYECLDVHRLMSGQSRAGAVLRGLERFLLRRSGLMIVSSNAFLSAYFGPRQGLGRTLCVPVVLVENKVFNTAPVNENVAPVRPSGPPWVIGWFGAIRCRRSLDILTSIAAARPDLVRIVIRGRPTAAELPDLADRIAHLPNVTFEGPYTATDLASMYGQVHFTWAVDYFEAGANSDWLLPNRIYEGGLFDAVPIALDHVETGHWLRERGLGLRIADPAVDLEPLLEAMTDEDYSGLSTRSRAAPRSMFAADVADCRSLLAALESAA